VNPSRRKFGLEGERDMLLKGVLDPNPFFSPCFLAAMREYSPLTQFAMMHYVATGPKQQGDYELNSVSHEPK
jgi:hypothetical protein